MKKLLPLGLLAVLVFLPLAYAANESDYKYGFKLGEAAYQCDKTKGCEAIYMNEVCTVTTNQTACSDGFLRGLLHAQIPEGPYKWGYHWGLRDGKASKGFNGCM